ncbi:site-specific integrase [Gordonia sp. ABSL49_1]|uniref:tyrosine-type recombinase/integrase n=1 Tax=Gordonia sp. ABSL49_1 TaxID=2920941 RepID=UPI001F0F48ED|nr:site-specific integrase [Gordonia sp. ABSL49_1]MCH5644244.1 site-specific integrase [Gordonia sp. ABSL49_1]
MAVDRWRHSLLRMVLEHALTEGWIAKNPAVQTIFPPLLPTEHLYLTVQEVEQLARLCHPYGDIVRILAYTGLRWGELTGLNVSDIDLDRRRIHVRRSMTQVGGKLVTGATKSLASTRTVPIPEAIVVTLRRRMSGRSRTAPAVAAPKGGRLGRGNWVRSVGWKKAKAELGYAELRIHDLRHTYASLARSAGADLRLLQRAMGHASITVTAHTYADLYDGELNQVADAIDVKISAEEPLGPVVAPSGDEDNSSDEL